MNQTVGDTIRLAADYEKQGNLTKALRCYEKAAKTGDREVLCFCAANCLKMSSEKARQKALDWCRESAMLDFADAQLMLARIYTEGAFGTRKNLIRANFWAAQAKANGSQEGKKLFLDTFATSTYAAFMVPDSSIRQQKEQQLKQHEEEEHQDRKELCKYRKRSAIQGDAISQYLYAGMLTSDKEALSWYEKSAQNGYAEAKYKCGAIYQEGNKIPKDFQKAFYWYNEAAKDGHGRAQLALAKMHDQGDGIQKDREQALYWYKKAAEQKVDGAQTRYDSIMRESDPEKQTYLASRKILICDSAAFMRMTLSSSLKKQGFQALREVAGLKELMEEYQRQTPELVFLAIKYTDDEMHSALTEISQRWPDAKIILVYSSTLDPYAESLEQKYPVIAGRIELPFTTDGLIGITLKNLGIS